MASATNQQVTVMGVFYDQGQAKAVRDEIQNLGIGGTHIDAHPDLSGNHPGTGYQDKGFFASLKDLFGDDDNSHGYGADYYAEAARRGGYVVRVTTDEDQAVQVQQIMQRYGVADAEKQSARWRQEGWTGYQENQSYTDKDLHAEAERRESGDEISLQIVEEELAVGKRKVERGGVRVVRRVTERPVEAQVSLRDETIHVDRHASGRNLTAEEAERAFAEGDRTLEITETDEEAVVGKTARVVEEVTVGKEAVEHTETVRDTVRRSDVDVEKIEGSGATSRTETVKTTETSKR